MTAQVRRDRVANSVSVSARRCRHPTVAATRGGERGSRRGNARGIRSVRPDRHCSLAACAAARAADDPPGRRRAGAAGVAQGARAPRLSGACAARGLAQPAVRAAVGRSQRSARRAALVPQQDPERRRRARPATGSDARGHRPARPDGLLRRCDRGRPRDPGGHRDASRPSGCRALAALFGGDFLDGLEIDRSPAFNGWLTAQRRRFRGCHAALLEHLAGSVTGRRGVRLSGEVARARAVRPARPRDVFCMRSRGAAGSARARSIWRRRPGCSRPRASIARPFATRGGRPGRQADGCAAGPGRHRLTRMRAAACSQPARASPLTPRRASIAVMPFVDGQPQRTARGGAADALAHDVITRLAKLRSLFVIAQGTVFALHERRIGPEEAGRMLNVDYVVSGSLQRRRQAPHRDGRAGRDAHRPHRLGGGLRSEAGRRVPRARRDRQPDRRVDRQRDRDDRAQPRHPEAAELAGRLGGASPRPVAHVPLQQGRQRAGAAFLRDRGAPRSDLRARLCRPVLHAFPERLPGLGEARAGNRPGLRRRRAEPDGRRSRPGRALGHGPGAVAARPPGPVDRRAGAGDRPEPELRARATTRSPSSTRKAAIRGAAISVVRPLAPSEPVRSAALRHARRPRHGAGASRAVRGGRRLGQSRPPPARTRTRISWRSPPSAWRWPAGSTRRAPIWRRSTRTLPGYRVDDFLAAMQFAPEGAALFREGAKRIGMD